jgi:hypothetical protein
MARVSAPLDRQRRCVRRQRALHRHVARVEPQAEFLGCQPGERARVDPLVHHRAEDDLVDVVGRAPDQRGREVVEQVVREHRVEAASAEFGQPRRRDHLRLHRPRGTGQQAALGERAHHRLGGIGGDVGGARRHLGIQPRQRAQEQPRKEARA